MIRLQFSINLGYEVIGQSADFIFNIHAAQTIHQTVRNESLTISQPLTSTIHYDPLLRHRLLRLQANPGPLKISYQAEVDIQHHVGQPESIGEMPIAELPMEVLPYLYPSRYCESDKLQQLVTRPLATYRRATSASRASVNGCKNALASPLAAANSLPPPSTPTSNRPASAVISRI